MAGLWGEEFDIPVKTEKEKVKKIIKKVSEPKEVTVIKKSKSSKSTISLKDQLEMIKNEVLRVLGKQKDNVIIIDNYEDYINYIDCAIKSGSIAVDTETNNSLDPITCKLMGLCLYYPGGKQAYIPVNHRNPDTKERLEWQLTEHQIAEGLNKIVNLFPKKFDWEREFVNQSYGNWWSRNILPKIDSGELPEIEMHNGKFDYQVIKCTCGIEMPIHWDTLIGCKLLDENEFSAGLKQQYVSKIDPDQEKYSIEGLFENVEYADVDPYIFALYAATDSLMTDRLKKYQEPLLKAKENEKIYRVFREIEMPLVTVLAEMELAGMEVDMDYGERLSKKNHDLLDIIDNKLSDLLKSIENEVAIWKTTPDALDKQKKKQSEKQRANALKSANYDDSLWSFSNGSWYKLSKARIEQLDDPITPSSLASPTQLSIILYHILGAPIVNQEKPDATGEEELVAIKKKNISKTLNDLCDLMLGRREKVKLLSTYIDNIPELAKRWPDNRVRTHFNQYGAATGRLSSSDPINFQNIPAHEKSIRLLFKAKSEDNLIKLNELDNSYEVEKYSEVNTVDGWKWLKELKIGDTLILDDGRSILKNIKILDNGNYLLYI